MNLQTLKIDLAFKKYYRHPLTEYKEKMNQNNFTLTLVNFLVILSLQHSLSLLIPSMGALPMSPHASVLPSCTTSQRHSPHPHHVRMINYN